ncbi:MAG: (d)CMP kinase [Wigglesworthia glossinidia]|nr:(d)CMP kinase [Wigglesworthia glossinidia]
MIRINQNQKQNIITIDGPSASGKGAISKRIATIFGWNILNSGAIYRSLAFLSIKNKISNSTEKKLIKLASELNLKFKIKKNKLHIILNNQDITLSILDETIGVVASKIALFPLLRKKILNIQKSFYKPPGLVAEGRDMGSIVFPKAYFKIFLDASLKIRAERRTKQLQNQGFNVTFKEIFSKIRDRDNSDINRKIAPLIPGKNALIINSTLLNVEEVVQIIFDFVKNS